MDTVRNPPVFVRSGAEPTLYPGSTNGYSQRDMSTENLPQSPEQPSRKPRVAVVFGGRSSEHGISVVTAGAVLKAIDRTKYDVLPIGITRDGRWALTADEPDRMAIVDRRPPDVDQLTVVGHGGFPYQVDGDFIGEVERLDIRYVPGALRLVRPPD